MVNMGVWLSLLPELNQHDF